SLLTYPLHLHPFFFTLLPPPPPSTLFPYTTLFRSIQWQRAVVPSCHACPSPTNRTAYPAWVRLTAGVPPGHITMRPPKATIMPPDRKSTRLNSSHVAISYAVFCLKKKKQQNSTAPY